MNNNKLKQSLVDSLEPVKRLAPVQTQLIRFFTIASIYAVATIAILKPKSNLFTLLENPQFTTELLILLVGIFVAGFSAIRSSRPGYANITREKISLALCIALWLLYLTFERSNIEAVNYNEHGYECANTIVITTLILSACFLTMLSRGAPLQPLWTGVAATTTCSLLGALILHFACESSTFSHLFFWHVCPAAVTPLLGFALYKRLFSW